MLYLVMEHAPNGSLLDYVRARKRLAEGDAAFILQQVRQPAGERDTHTLTPASPLHTHISTSASPHSISSPRHHGGTAGPCQL